VIEGLEEAEGCTWQVGGNYPDSPPEYCELESDPASEESYCSKHEASAKAMEEWERENPPQVETL
jgi:hypothetical protein